MKLNPDTLDETLANFLAAWPFSRINTMTVEEYANLSNHDSLCYWLEYGTKNLGEIGDNALSKFEFWKPKGHVQFKDRRFITDGTYAWNAKRGTTRSQAFEDVRNNIIQIITHAQNGNLEEIEKIPFHQIAKWKIAFCYSKKALLPVYSTRALIAIAQGLGRLFPYKTKVSELQRFLLQHKPTNQTVDEFAYSQYSLYARKIRPNFYIIGSKYGSTNSVMKDFIEKSCVAIGFMADKDFSFLMGKDDSEINNFVEENWKEKSPNKIKIKSYFKRLSNIKAGDIIAIKSHGTHNQLTIIAYAQVVERNGNVYENKPNELGHHIYVEFLDTGLYNNLGLTYAETIHKISQSSKDFYKIFGWYANPKFTQGDEEELVENNEEKQNDESDEDENDDYNEKSEDIVTRGPIAAGIVKKIHNRIQNRFVKYLKKTFPNDKTYGEKRRIDVRREGEQDVFIYEIKPHMSAYSCTREAIGQLLDYSHQFRTNKSKRIVVVGPIQPDERAQAFIDSVRNNLEIPFSYLAFDEKNMTVIEY